MGKASMIGYIEGNQNPCRGIRLGGEGEERTRKQGGETGQRTLLPFGWGENVCRLILFNRVGGALQATEIRPKRLPSLATGGNEELSGIKPP